MDIIGNAYVNLGVLTQQNQTNTHIFESITILNNSI